TNLLEKDPEKRVANAQVLARRLEAMKHGLASLGTIHAAPPAEPAVVLHHDSIHDRPTEAADAFLQPGVVKINSEQRPGPVGIEARDASASPDAPLGATAEMPAAPGAGIPAAPLPRSSSNSPVGALPTRDRMPGFRPATVTGTTGRFTTVPADEESGLEIDDEESAGWISPQTWVLALSILIVG